MTGELLAFPSKATISVVANSTPANGGGGGGRDVTDITMKDYVDAQSQATRAQNDARFAEVLSEIRSLDAKISNLPTRWTIWGTAISTTLTLLFSLAGLVYAIISYGGDRFDSGAQFTASTYQASQEAKTLSEENARQIQQLGGNMEKLIDALSTPAAPAP